MTTKAKRDALVKPPVWVILWKTLKRQEELKGLDLGQDQESCWHIIFKYKHHVIEKVFMNSNVILKPHSTK